MFRTCGPRQTPRLAGCPEPVSHQPRRRMRIPPGYPYTARVRFALLDAKTVFVRKPLLAQQMVRIQILAVMSRTKRDCREVRRLLAHSPGAQDVRVGSFDNVAPIAHSRTDCASQRPNPSQILQASVGTSSRLEPLLAERHSPFRKQTSWRRLRQSGRRAHLACVNGNVKISRRRAKNHPGQYRPASGWFSKWKT
jgi:hypothetical protein